MRPSFLPLTYFRETLAVQLENIGLHVRSPVTFTIK